MTVTGVSERIWALGVFLLTQVMKLLDFPEGELGEIVSLEPDAVVGEVYGANVGMPVIVLHKAVEWLVQIGYNQIHLGREQLQKIQVKPASL